MKRKSIRKMFNWTATAAIAFLLVQTARGPSREDVQTAVKQAIDAYDYTSREEKKNVEEAKLLEDKNIRSKVVRIYSEKGMCSGEQVKAPSGESYILTASHCRGLAHNDTFSIRTEGGAMLERKLIAEDPKSDLLLLEGLPGVTGLEIAKFDFDGQDIRGYTHGHNHSTYLSNGQLLETTEVKVPVFMITTDEDAAKCAAQPKYKDEEMETFFGSLHVCLLDTFQTATTASISPGSSGGPMVDDAGALVGVVSAGDGTFGSLVTLTDIRAFLSGY